MTEINAERREGLIDLEHKVDATLKILKETRDDVKQTRSEVNEIFITLHGRGKDPGFIGETQGNYRLHEQRLNKLDGWLRYIILSILAAAFIIIRNGVTSS